MHKETRNYENETKICMFTNNHEYVNDFVFAYNKSLGPVFVLEKMFRPGIVRITFFFG